MKPCDQPGNSEQVVKARSHSGLCSARALTRKSNATPRPGPTHQQHAQPNARHHAERPKHGCDEWVLVAKGINTFDLAIPVVCEVERGQFGDGNLNTVALCGLVGQGKQHCGCAALRQPNAFNRGNFGGLVL
jgi:hypothetical protein